MSWCECQIKAFLLCNPSHGFLAAMRGTVVEDDVKILVWIRLQQPTQETDKGNAVVALNGFRADLTSVYFK